MGGNGLAKMRIRLYTLGCKVNQYDTQAMAELFISAGWEIAGDGQPADAVLLNTCTVTAEADRKCRQMLRHAAQDDPGAVMIVAGCYAMREGEQLVRDGLADLVIGTEGRSRVVTLIEEIMRGKALLPRDSLAIPRRGVFEPLVISSPGERTRANLKIQEGCDRFCAYCIIPYVRGPIRSRDAEETLAEAQRLAEAGARELVLTGIHIASYGRDRDEKPEEALLSLLKGLSVVPGIIRLRLGSLEPVLMSERFIAGLREISGLCPHFHLSLQSGCDATLLRMRRRYTTASFLQGLERIRQVFPEAALTTDVIVGFPGETEEEFAVSCETVRRAGFSRIHVFPYSRREGTPAAAMPGQCTRAEKKGRAAVMEAIGTASSRRYMAGRLGRIFPVLTETRNNGLWEGYTPEYIRVRFTGETVAGEIVPVRLTEICESTPDTCLGEKGVING
ncbi:MAG: tRNA (N(6)-L-threonylcarbamoyladenosine(37)-C(2))-methylthiotransferase MtaB [Christensenellales bacterium]|jgi:threonylcarbamoyladenosine tRNA methylthiotransferase MtaB